MTPEQIREAVELAEGFDLTEDQLTFPSGHWFTIKSADDFQPWMIAALASQLKRQAYAMEPDLSITETTRYIHLSGPQGHILTIEGHEPDENSILACTEFLRGRK